MNRISHIFQPRSKAGLFGHKLQSAPQTELGASCDVVIEKLDGWFAEHGYTIETESSIPDGAPRWSIRVGRKQDADALIARAADVSKQLREAGYQATISIALKADVRKDGTALISAQQWHGSFEPFVIDLND